MMEQTKKDLPLKQLEAKIEQLEAEMSFDAERLEIEEEIDRSASFFMPLFLASLFTIALLIINKLVAG